MAISEDCFFNEQLEMFKSVTDSTYNYHAVSAFDNSPVASGGMAHGGVAILWDYSLDEHILHLQRTLAGRVIGIECTFTGCSTLFILAAYLPSTNHNSEECNENFDLLWALYDSLSQNGLVTSWVILMAIWVPPSGSEAIINPIHVI